MSIDIEYSPEEFKELIPPKSAELYDIENTLIIGRALGNLTPYEARDERLWAYITHTVGLEYARKRWQIPENDNDAVNYILSHIFATSKRHVERDNAISRLWWLFHLCNRADDIPLELALKVFLYRSDVRANIVERPSTSQSLPLFGAILTKLIESFEGEQTLFERQTFRSFIKEINTLGGFILLDCLSRSKVSEMLDEVIFNKLQISKV